MVSLGWLRRIPIRVRLTLWYVLLLGLTLCVFSGYLYFRLQHSLLSQVDSALQVTTAQALANLLDRDAALLAFNQQAGLNPNDETSLPFFQNTETMPAMARRKVDFAIRLIGPDGNVWWGFGDYKEVPLWVPQPTPEYISLKEEGDNELWRVYSQPVQIANSQATGWLQVAQSLEDIQEPLKRLRGQIVLGLPLVLLLAGGGGFLLASWALRPIDRITRTAQTIGASDLTRRIAYQGPTDEVGRLATTFDQMLDRLQAAFERERRFTADASHELRTPLTALKGRIGVTLSLPRSQAEHESTLQDLEKEVDRLIRLSTDLLFLARLGQGQLHRQPETLNLSQLLDAIVEQVQPLAENKNLSLVKQISPGLSIQGDPDHLIRLFLNLLDNAIKYTPSGGQVVISAESRGATAKVMISDSGSGIPAEHLPHLFEPFYRAEAARSRSRGGAGLGLAIAHEIARWHGGTLEVQSEPGRGTTFTVHLSVHLPEFPATHRQ